jgi:hypothetical protein
VKVGDRFSFGAYEQDNNSNNGKEQIVWRVLKVESDRALVISDQILDRQKYHTKSFSVTWETSSIREWLNDKFLQSAFTADERQQILTVTVPAQDHPAPQTDNLARLRGNDTRDQIFLLNAQEAEALFGSDEDRQAYPTQYTASHGIDSRSVKKPASWFLRQPHPRFGTATATVNQNGKLDVANVDYEQIGIRPAMWIRIQ